VQCTGLDAAHVASYCTITGITYISRVVCTKVTKQSISNLDFYSTRKISTSSTRWRQPFSDWSISFRVISGRRKELKLQSPKPQVHKTI